MRSLWGSSKVLPASKFLELSRIRPRSYSMQLNLFALSIKARISTSRSISSAYVSIQGLSNSQREQIELYVRSLLDWNQRMNLTAVTDEEAVMERHVEDSLAILAPLRRHYLSRCREEGRDCVEIESERLRIVDIGSGAGLPGLILAIACPSWHITLVESMLKRCSFLEHAIDVTGLSNVRVLRERAEIAGQNPEFRETFDVAVARAVAEMRTLAEYCLPLVRVGGLFLAAKGPDPQEEVESAQKAVKLLGGSIKELCLVDSYGPHGCRTAVICYKERPTLAKYPRQPGIPSKMPL
ncbi:S-adenosyl-L-methionine-dependent methyltransferases superfamily protein [Wolffia australiana]